MKTAIMYASVHHGNTRKVVETIASTLNADLIDVTVSAPNDFDLGAYELIGFASGIYYGGIHKKIVQAIQAAEFRPDQRVFSVITAGAPFINHGKRAAKLLDGKNVRYLGNFQCRGYDTFGIFGKLGGIAKGHPSAKDLDDARAFAEGIRNSA